MDVRFRGLDVGQHPRKERGAIDEQLPRRRRRRGEIDRQRPPLRPLTEDGFDERSRTLGLDGCLHLGLPAGADRIRLLGSLPASEGENASYRCRGQQEQPNDHGAKDSASGATQDRWTKRVRTRENRL